MPARPIAVFGGTFDPPHNGHLVLGECVASQFGCEVLFVPAGDPYRKTGTDTPENQKAAVAARIVTPGTVRLEMIELAIAGNSKFRADGRDTPRRPQLYTVDTLRELSPAKATGELILVLGSDALADMRTG